MKNTPALLIASILALALAPATRAADVFWGGGTGAITDNNWYSSAALTTAATRANSDTINLASGTVFITDNATVYDTNIGLAAGDNAAVIVSGTWTNTNLEISIGGVSGTSALYPVPTGGDGSLTILSSGSVRAYTFYVGSYGSGTFHLAKGAGLTNTANAWFGRNAAPAPAYNTAIIDGTWNVGGYFRLGHSLNTSSTLIVNGLIQVDSTTGINSIGYTGNNKTATDTSASGVLVIAQTGTVAFSGTETTLGHLGRGSTDDYHSNASGTAIVNGVWLQNNATLIVGRSGAGHLHVGQTGTATAGRHTIIGQYKVFNAKHPVGSPTDGPSGGTLIVDGYFSTGTYVHVASSANSRGNVDVSGRWAVGTSFQVGYQGSGTLNITETGTVTVGTYSSLGGQNSGHGTATVAGLWTNKTHFYLGRNPTVSPAAGNVGTGILNILPTGTVTVGGDFRAAASANSGQSNNAGVYSTGTASVAGLLDISGNLALGELGDAHLHIISDGAVLVGGNYSQNAQSSLAVTLDSARATPCVTISGAAALGGALRLEGVGDFSTPADKSGDLRSAFVLLAGGGITGDFATITPAFTGTAGLPDYIFLGRNVLNLSEYHVGHFLAWNAPAANAHGAFTVDAGKTFTIDTPLADRTGVARFTSGWDGKSLVKRGAGTLVLAAADTRTGDTTIESGTLRVATPAVSLGNLINTAVLDLGGSTVGGYHTAEALTLVGSGTIILALESAAPGAAGDKLIINGDASGTHATYVSINGAAPVAATPAQIAARITVAGSNTATFDGTGVPAGLAVTFNPQGGTVSPASKAIQRNTAYGALPTPVRGSTVFDGWWTAPTGGTQVTSGTMVASDATSHILYARWKTGHQDIIPEVGNDLYGSIMDETGAPVEGVVVSDGYSCVKTDANGVYQMKRNTKARVVYYSTPENYAINTLGTPAKPGMALFHAKLSDSQQRYDFDLVRLPAPEKDFILLGVGDPQVRNTSNLARYKNETIADLIQFRKTATLPVYAILLGDICYDSLPLLGSIRDTTNLAGIPHFGVIGNHDHDQTISDDYASSAEYEETYGPANYSFNRGDVHIIGLDNVIYKASQSYDAGFTDEQVEWLRQDLLHVPKSKFLIVAYHIPIRNTTTIKNYTAVMNLLKGFAGVHFMAGHTHYHQNVRITAVPGGYEHIHGGACGAWWNSLVNLDGAPNGYGVFTFSENKINDWYYKPTGYSDTYQMRMYRGNASFGGTHGTYTYGKASNVIVVDAWNSDTDWTLVAYEDGVEAGTLTKDSARSDAYASGYHKGVLGRTSDSYNGNKNNHLYYHTLKNPAATRIEIRATDPFGKTYTLSDFTTDLDEFPANFASPEITAHPADATANAGQSVTFTAAAAAAPAPWFKWQSSGDGATWADVSAASATALTLTATAPMDGVQYRFVATNARGSATSAAATLTVNQAPAITTQPSNQSVIEGQNATFTVAATGKPTPTFQWQSAPAGSNTWGDISGATFAAYTAAAATTAQNGMQYRCVASNGINPDATSATAILTVTSKAVADAQTLKNQLEAPGTGTVTVSGTVDLSLVGGATLAPGKTIVGADANSTITGNLTIPESASGAVITGVNFTGGTLTINGANDVDVSHCSFTDAPVSITGESDNIAFSWNKFTATGGSGSAMTIANAGASTGILLHNNLWDDGLKSDMPRVTNAQVYMFNNYITATGNTTATVAGAGAQILSVNNLYEGTNNPLTTEPTGKLHASGNDTTTTTGTTATGADAVFVPAYSHVITPVDTLATLIAANAGNTAGQSSVTPPAFNGTVAISATVTGVGSGTTSVSANVPAMGGFTLTANATGFTPDAWQWYRGNSAIEGATSATYAVTSADKDTHAGTYAVALTAATGEIVTSGAFTVTVGELAAPVITTQPASKTIKVGDSTTFTVTATGAGLTYQWKKNGTDIPGATNANLVVTNAQKSDAGSYTVVVTNPAGSKTSNPATLTVNTASSDGGGGGGGAPSLFLIPALLLLLAGRSLRLGRKPRKP
ncbi:autotransporter-associated beta strand protein/T5SS/PEP-CTERM-associated repeat protein [Ereboglobus sp. PH5-10]|uniref:immunoglobulin domain-containing protein n=1 Tax=Ereboglobus sp. PH5-10 TaxID=2940629 RepID=UPI00240665C7|nr:calcineurin-like phosphoesterase C-terminal domain-containing protein [Ereboglobus sp. PH5-10]MDF9827773.1 autotransporter-associated beta strand protein/T5SS/PEP-CTERM-associated repeat protein [Ereboglobus sp. PH5-10]